MTIKQIIPAAVPTYAVEKIQMEEGKQKYITLKGIEKTNE